MEISFDPSLCVRCGCCVRSCSAGVLTMTENGPAVRSMKHCLSCWHCASACPRNAVRANGEPIIQPHAEGALEELILSRRAIRHFKNDPPPRELISWALDRAAYAPSGKNRHENRWTVVYGREQTAAIVEAGLEFCRTSGEAPELLPLAEKGMDLLTGHAPVVIVGWSPDDCLNPCVDAVIALHTAELLLVEKGVGTCWGGYLRRLTNKSDDLRARLHIPAGCSVQCCLFCGWPDRERYPNIPPRPAAEPVWLAE